MSHTVTLIPGDGIGPEVTEAARRVIEATGVSFKWEVKHAGTEMMEKFGTPLPEPTLESVRKNKVALKGPITTPIGSGFRSVNVALRKELDLYACLRPCKSYRGIPSPFKDVDIVMVRENTEDLYAGVEFDKGSPEAADIIKIAAAKKMMVRADSAVSLKTISVTATRKIVKFAFEYARNHKRKKVTAITKANILKFTDGLFLSVAREVAKEYPGIEYEERLVDASCMQLVRTPKQFDVMVMPNLYGDILSDLCAGLVGGLGVAPGANIGEKTAVFEPSHGSAPKYAGMNKVNPVAMMLSGVMMLRYLDEVAAADKLEKAIAAVIAEGKKVTYDLRPGGRDAVGTSQVADAVIEKMGGKK